MSFELVISLQVCGKMTIPSENEVVLEKPVDC